MFSFYLETENKNKNKVPVYDNLLNSDANSMSIPAPEEFESVSLSDLLPKGLGVGSMVEVSVGEKDFYGVIRWIGVSPDGKNVMVGVELEDDQDYKQLQTTDGSFNGVS